MSVEAVSEFLEPFAGDGSGFIAITKATRSEDPDKNSRWEGHTLSNLYLETHRCDFALPEEVLEANPFAEFYFAPAIFSDEFRRESHFKYSNALWVDFDEPVNWKALDPAPSIVVQTSGNGKVHCYWLLEKPMTDANDLRYWNKRLQEGYGEGADPSGFDAAQLLKLPYGRNLKLANRDALGNYFEPKVLKFNTDLRYGEPHFSHLPEPSTVGIAVDLTNIGDAPDTDKSFQEYLDEYSVSQDLQLKILKAQDGGEEKRSGALFSLESALFDADFDADQVFHILWRSPNDKFSADFGPNRGAHRLWQDIRRVEKKRQAEEAATTSTTTEVSRILNDKKMSLSDKGKAIDLIVERDLTKVGEFIQTEFGDFFYLEKRTEITKMYRVDTSSTGPFAGKISDQLGLSPGADRTLLSGALHKCVFECQRRPKVPIRYFAHYDQELQRVYVDRNDGTMYVLDGETIVRKHHGHDGVYFHRRPDEAYPKVFNYTPDYTKGGLDALVLTGPNYTEGHGRVTKRHLKHILLTWISTFFFPTMMNTRPIVLFHGEADSGKSSFFQNLSLIFTGHHTHSVVGMPRDVKDFNVQVCKNSFIFYDNVEVNKKEMQEKLAQVATGFSVRDRKLHTNSDESIMTARAFVGITSRTIEKIQKDVAQRYIIIPVHPYATTSQGGRKAMSAVLAEVANNRDALFSELLDFVNRIVREIVRNGLETEASRSIKMRMADYAMFLHLTSSLVGLSGPEMENYILKKQAETLDENDSMVRALHTLVSQPGYDEDQRWRGKELYEHLRMLDRKFVREYSSERKFLSALKANINGGQLLFNGVDARIVKHSNVTKYVMKRVDPDDVQFSGAETVVD